MRVGKCEKEWASVKQSKCELDSERYRVSMIKFVRVRKNKCGWL